MTEIITTRLDCGMTLVVEHLQSVASAAMGWLIPAGSAVDPTDRIGLSTLLSEMINRGAGILDSRQFSDALDLLGVRRSTDLTTHHLHIAATLLGRNLMDALPLITSMICEPKLPADHMDAVRSLCLQSLDSLKDDPQDQVMLLLRERHRPQPFNRNGYGDADVLRTATRNEVASLGEKYFNPAGSIFAAAGAVDADQLAKRLDSLLKEFNGSAPEPTIIQQPQRGYLPIIQETSQVHIGMACDAPPEPAADSMLEHLAIAVLSGGSSGRLFTEVRQRRSLCYSVGASYRASRDSGTISVYAGTTPERAQETLDVTLSEIHKMREGATQQEFDRSVTRMKSRLVMSGESTPARAGAIASDYFRLGRARTLDERTAEVEAISLKQLNAYLARRTYGPFTLVSIGPQPLTAPRAMESETPTPIDMT